MPRVYLTETDKQDADFEKIIRQHMGYELLTITALASQIDMPRETLSRKLKNPDRFSRRELRMICRRLHVSEDLKSKLI